MAPYTTIADRRDVEGGYVVDVTIRQTEDDKYPSGWDYSFHLGEIGGATVLRFTTTRTNEPKATNATLGTTSNTSSSPGC